MKTLAFLSLILCTATGFAASAPKPKTTGPAPMATCTGSDPCLACKTCNYCKHCAQQGGTCGVKKK